MILLTLLLVGALSGAALIGWVVYASTHLPAQQPSQTIIVLGAQIKPDGTPSEMLYRRLSRALAEYRQQPQLIITCGARGDNEPAAEGDVMRQWLLDQGVPAGDVVAETHSFNTRENLLYAQKMMAEREAERALIVTSDYHVARALALCKQLNIAASGVGAPTDPQYWPKNYSREALSWVKFWLQSFLGITGE